MALKLQPMTLDTGITVQEPYAKILNNNQAYAININRVVVSVGIWANAQARTDGKRPLKINAHEFENSEATGLLDDGRAELYAKLKTLPDSIYLSSTDC